MSPIIENIGHTTEISSVRDGLSTSAWTARTLICWATKIAADCSIYDERVVREMGGDITVRRRKKGSRSTPSGRIGLLSLDIGGDARSRETPDPNTCVVPEMGEDTSCIDIEPMSIRLRVGIEEGASTVVGAAARTLIAYDVRKCALRIDVGANLTTSRGVQRVLVGGSFVDAFHDVNFT